MEGVVFKAAVFFLLLINSLVDIKSRKINLTVTLLAGGAGAAACIFFRNDGLRGLLLSLLPGMLLILMAAVSRGGIGMGDGIVMIAAGFFSSRKEIWDVFLLGFLLAGIYAAVLFWRRRRGEERFAFVPFLLLADILILLSGG